MGVSQPALLFNIKAFNTVTINSNKTSNVIDISDTTGYCVHAYWTTGAVGNLLLEGSNNPSDPNSFSEISSQLINNSADSMLLNLEQQHYIAIRLRYESTSGSGTLTAYVSSKRF